MSHKNKKTFSVELGISLPHCSPNQSTNQTPGPRIRTASPLSNHSQSSRASSPTSPVSHNHTSSSRTGHQAPPESSRLRGTSLTLFDRLANQACLDNQHRSLALQLCEVGQSYFSHSLFYQLLKILCRSTEKRLVTLPQPSNMLKHSNYLKTS